MTFDGHGVFALEVRAEMVVDDREGRAGGSGQAEAPRAVFGFGDTGESFPGCSTGGARISVARVAFEGASGLQALTLVGFGAGIFRPGFDFDGAYGFDLHRCFQFLMDRVWGIAVAHLCVAILEGLDGAL